MPHDSDGRSAPRDVSRRHLFKQVGLAGAAAAVSAAVPAAASAQAPAGPPTSGAVPKAAGPQVAAPAMPRLEALETLTAAEADTLEAIVARPLFCAMVTWAGDRDVLGSGFFALGLIAISGAALPHPR